MKKTLMLLNCLICAMVLAQHNVQHISNQQAAELMQQNTKNGFLENKGQLKDDKGFPVPFIYFKSSQANFDLFYNGYILICFLSI